MNLHRFVLSLLAAYALMLTVALGISVKHCRALQAEKEQLVQWVTEHQVRMLFHKK